MYQKSLQQTCNPGQIVLVLAVQLVAQQASGKIAEWTAKSPSKTGKTLPNHRHNVVDNVALVLAVAQ
jgi:hypothetical protein